MNQLHDTPAQPSEPLWDIVFTRLVLAVGPQLLACALDLERRFRAMGLNSDTQTRQTPRGFSTFMAIVGQRGLICIVDMTLVDGLAVGLGPCAALDIRLLDACGDVAAEGLAHSVHGCILQEASVTRIFIAENLNQIATTIYVAIMGHFDLLLPSVDRI